MRKYGLNPLPKGTQLEVTELELTSDLTEFMRKAPEMGQEARTENAKTRPGANIWGPERGWNSESDTRQTGRKGTKQKSVLQTP